MKSTVFFVTAAIGLSGLLLVREGEREPALVADAATSPAVPAAAQPMIPAAPAVVRGDLVIDFMGGVRGYVEPCG